MPAGHELHPNLAPRIDGGKLVGRKGKPYHAAPGLIAAANVALELGRPLLLTGEPGCGKTDFAWAAASALGASLKQDAKDRVPLQCYVRSDTRARDLLYFHDSIRRFGDAQNGGPEGLKRASDPRSYIELQPLGRALVSTTRRVVLIDEIDKAPRDLPNDLLRELDQTAFEIAEIPENPPPVGDVTSHGVPLRRLMDRPLDSGGEMLAPPFILITSNIERQLPDAFLRRCIFWHIKFPADLLPDILADHFPDHTAGDFLQRTLAVYTHVRDTRGFTRKPGTAELIDWVAALTRVFSPAHAAGEIRRFSDALQAQQRVAWDELPGLGCLVKMREDQEALFRA